MSTKRSWELARGAAIAPGRRVIHNLGGGGRTEVYRCTDDVTGTPVVVKVLRPGRTGGADRQHLAREAETLAALDHPGFPSLLDADLETERAYLVVEHVEGPHLSTLLKEFGPLEPEQLRPLARDVAAALAHLHERGIVHLDVKPRNIVMGEVPVLLDLGAARSVEACRPIPAGTGTVTTLSPEQAEPTRLGPVTPAADVFCLGVTLLLACGLESPLRRRRDDPRPGEEELHSGLLASAGSIQGPFGELVRACLAFDAGERPTAAAVAAALTGDGPHSGGVVRRMALTMRGLSGSSQRGLTGRS